MDYRQYDPAIGRFNSMDVLSELAFSITPYRFAYNNPIYFSDPTGLFETRKEAREYRREHNITGSIVKENDGSFAINDKNNAISYFKPPEGVEVSTMGSDGVATSALATESNNGGFPGIKENTVLWGGNLKGDLEGWKRGKVTNSINTDAIPIMGPAARSVNGPNAFERLFSALKNAWDLWTKVENIESVAKDGNVSKGTIEVQNVEPVMIDMPLLNHTATSTSGGNVSTIQEKKIKDTAVAPSQTGNIDQINKRSYRKAAQERDANNHALQQRLNYYKQ
ncbi:RHS repeat-associated core domain-containing protein [Flavobacterium sp. PL02]|uniref:RHS repeat protein n=1 Tax=Flavobacterium sp. PL02 TaxID=3088354 RepID=UPI002B222FF8|nr:RHS repeat-associated core domain-containing protein [Flavobacterium sp. PL02]MEA9412711.1 RHS repeat-associated core domain-containing protein [Flavobacterium sp. PL02]